MKKIILVLLAMSLFLGINISSVRAEENKDYSIILFDNAEEKGNWIVPPDVAGTVQEMTEAETDFVRFVPSAANDYMYIELPDGGVKIENTSITEIDMRIRGYEIDGGKARMQIKWNMPKKLSDKMTLVYNGDEELKGKVSYNDELGRYTTDYGVGANHLVLADFLTTGVRLSNGVYVGTTMAEQSNWNNGLTSLTKGKINSKWWRMVIQIKPGYQVTYKLYDENNNMVGDEQKGTIGWIEQSGYLKNIAIQSFNGKLDYADVDYIKVSAFKSEVTSELLGAVKIGSAYEVKLDDYFKVGFDLPIDEETLNEDNVKLYNIDEDATVGIKDLEYDKDKNILTIMPDKDLGHGNYKILLSGNIKTTEIYPNLTEKYLNLKETVYIIKYYATNPPEVKNVEISGERLVGKTLTGKYLYISPDDVEEADTELRWYISDKENGQFELMHEGESIILGEEHHGKFIKLGVIPIDETGMIGSEAFSGVLGPIVNNWTEDTNIVSDNTGFETGTTDRWIAGGNQKIALVEDAYSGNYAMEVSVANEKWGYKGVGTKANTAYLVSIQAKSTAGNKPMYWYSWDGARCKDFDFCNYNASGKEGTGILAGNGTNVGTDWTTVSDVMVSYTSFSATPAIVYWGATSSFVVDDFYMGELMISGIEADIPEKISIPETEDVIIPIENVKVLNQIGTEVGFEGAPVRFEIQGNVPGVSIENEGIKISRYATVGSFDIKVICNPFEDTGSVRYSGVEMYEETINVSLEGNGNITPKIIDAKLSGSVGSGDILSLDYVFYQLYGEEDKSEITWWYSKEKTGDFEVIEGASGKTYMVTQDKAEGYFKVRIVPKTASAEGASVWTGIIGAKEAPVASDIRVSGEAFVGKALYGSYSYSDFNEDAEGKTIFRWLRAESENGEYRAIENATEKTYVLTDDDIGKYIMFEVTPVSVSEPFQGMPVCSIVFEGPKPPEARKVTIEKKGNSYVGSYEYYQQAGAQEGKSIYKWIVDGRVVSNDISYTPDFSGRKTIEFEITPVSVEKPYEGKPVTVSTVVGKITSGGGGGSSSGGGTPTMIGVTTVVEKASEEKASEKISDIKGHWSESAVKWAIDNKIMETKAAVTFAPDEFATRKEIITYMARVLEWEKSQYKGVFSDVDGEFGDLLQTFVDKGVISVDMKFRPDDYLTRQELSKIMAISLGMTSVNTDKTAFSDNHEIGIWAIPYVNAVYESGLIKGVGNNLFAPRGNVTRAQLATLLQRISEKN